MTKREYAEQVAVMVNGKVVEMEKANGVVLTGVTPIDKRKVSPIVYIDTAFDNGVSVEDAASDVEATFNKEVEGMDVDFMSDYVKVKPRLRVALYNKKTKAPMSKSALDYGFPDLIMVPYVTFGNVNGSFATAKVREDMLDTWGKTADEIYADALDNIDTDIVPMDDMLASLMGSDAPTEINMDMFVVSNTDRYLGAISVIKAHDKLKETFPEGYYVIPSSIHEVIVVSKDNIMYDALNNMICEVNATQLAPDEVLSNIPYSFN